MSAARSRRYRKLLAVVLVLATVLLLLVQEFSSRQTVAALTWTRPTETVLGEPSDDIAGYTVRCWQQGGSQSHVVTLDDPSVTHYELDALPRGRYQCAVSAFTSDGIESDLSDFVARTVH